MPPQISIVASAARPEFWQRFVDSLHYNKVSYEIIFVGPNPPIINSLLRDKIRYFESNVKPAQCYEIGLRKARGTLVHWTADDADYAEPSLGCLNVLDVIWYEYEKANNPKLILAMETHEDGNNVSEDHRFFFADHNTPRMAPLGFINREWMLELGGYDRNFVCGQSENDLVMRGLVEGGEVKLVKEAKVYLHHAQCHGVYSFRSGYNTDREYLENCWVKEGFGTYQTGKTSTLSPTRLRPFEPFSDEDIFTVSQGPKGQW